MDRIISSLRHLRNTIVSITPWVIRGVMRGLRVAIRMALWIIGMLFAAFWVGAPNAVRKIAFDLTDQAHNKGMLDPYVSILYYALCVVVSIVIGFCWIFTAYVTVWLVILIV